jgi:WD40 repeat protein
MSMSVAQAADAHLKVFISYSRRNAVAADALVDALTARGFGVTIDRRDLEFGEKWQAELAEFIRMSDTVIWLLSEASIQSKWVNWELDEVAKRNKRLVPVMVGETSRDRLPRQLGEIHILPAEGLFDLARDLDTLVRLLETDRAWLKEASRLADRAHEWLGHGRNSALLQRSAALRAAERWKDNRPAKAPAPAQAVLDLILASRQAATRRQRWWIAGSVAVALGATGLAVSAFVSQREAQRQLRDSHLAQAIMLRGTGDPGRRSTSLALLTKAANLRVGNDLRGEAVAAMALVELQKPREWNGSPLGTKGIGFNSNLERYARGDDQGNISIRRIVDDTEMMHLPGFGSHPWVLRFSPDDRYLAAKYDGDQLKDQLYVWDLSRPGIEAKYLGTTCNTAFDFDLSSQVLAVGRCDGSGSIDMFDLGLASSMPTKSLKQTAIPQFIAFRPDGRQLAVSSGNQPAVQVLELNQNKAGLSISIPTGAIGIAWNADGGLLAAAATDHRIYVWDVAKLRQGSNSPEPLQVLTGHQAEVTQISFSATNNLLASTSSDETVRIWEPIGGKELIHAAGTYPMRFSADGRRLAFKAGTQRLVRWELAAPSEYRAVRSREAPKGPWSADFSPDGRLLASAHGDGLRIWDLSDNKEIALVDQTEDGDRLGYIRSVLFHPDGTKLITCGPGDEGVPGRGGVYIWPIESQPGGIANALQVRKSRKIDLPKGAVCEWATLGDKGRTLLVADSGNGQVMLRDLDRPAEWTLLPLPDVKFVASHPDGRWIAYGRWKLGVWALDLRTNNSKELERSPASFFAVFSPNGKWLVTGSPDIYHVWEVGSWAKPVHDLPGYHGIAGLVGPLAFSPDGTMLAVARSSSVVELVDATKGWKEIVTLKSPDPEILNWLEFSADGSQLAVVTGGHLIYIWDLRAIREHLAEMDLDWELPPYPSSQTSLLHRREH